MLLASIDIYGVLAYLTNQRVREIGVRMARGASAHSVMGLVFRQSLKMTVLGIVMGSSAALAAARLLCRLVQGMQPVGAISFTVTIVVLLAAALLASFLPAYRASRVDPMRALRQD